MKKLILKVELHDGNDKRKAMKTVSALTGIDSISMDMKEKKLVVIGTVDPIDVVSKLRKFWPTDIISVGPAVEPKKEEPKKEEPKKEEPKKEEPKKEEPKKEEPKKEDEGKKEEEPKKEEGKKEEEAAAAPAPTTPPAKKAEVPEAVVGMIMPYHRPSYYPPMNMNTFYHQYQPHHHSIEENPNACVIS